MSNEAKFTPGPWYAPNAKDVKGYDASDPLIPWEIADVVGGHPPGIQQANAHLIAAAPEMYEELEYLSSLLSAIISEGCDGYTGLKNHVENLLSKARGETP